MGDFYFLNAMKIISKVDIFFLSITLASSKEKMAMSLVFVALKKNFFLLIFLNLPIGNFSEPIGKKGGVLPLGMGPNLGPKMARKGTLNY